MRPADELRAAARLLRETASKATEGPWQMDGPHWWHEGDCTHVITDTRNRWSVAILPRAIEAADRRDGDAAWIALASPALAEPLADLLRSIATVHEQPPCDAPEACNRCAEPDPVIIDALRVIEELKARQS